VARVLIVGCGCRGRALGAALADAGHAVRGTSRAPERVPPEPVEGVVADPARLATLTPHLDGVTVVCWLLGSADADAEALHGPRLETLLEWIVDTPVRGLVYEAAGPLGDAVYGRGVEICEQAARTWHIPVEVLRADPARHDEWTAAATAAVESVLAA
jgi:hypothetical protein